MSNKSYPWAAGSPVGSNGEQMHDIPDPKPAFASWGVSTPASSILSLGDNTTLLDIAVVSGTGGGGLALRWVASTDTQGSVIASGATANFDHAIPGQWRMRLAVPVEKPGVPNSVVGIAVKQGLYRRVAIIGTSAPVPSVFIAEH